MQAHACRRVLTGLDPITVSVSQMVVSPRLSDNLILLSVQCSSIGLKCSYAQRCSSAIYPNHLLLSVFLWSTSRNSRPLPPEKKRKKLPTKLSLHSKNVALFTSQTMESHLVSEPDFLLIPVTSQHLSWTAQVLSTFRKVNIISIYE